MPILYDTNGNAFAYLPYDPIYVNLCIPPEVMVRQQCMAGLWTLPADPETGYYDDSGDFVEYIPDEMDTGEYIPPPKRSYL